MLQPGDHGEKRDAPSGASLFSVLSVFVCVSRERLSGYALEDIFLICDPVYLSLFLYCSLIYLTVAVNRCDSDAARIEAVLVKALHHEVVPVGERFHERGVARR